ncbi:MAG: Ig-like domain-containing protein [Bacteroidales bacterium]|nr:Ig-like domain-containing protein [Bacteroidales bacterium]
MKKLLSIIAVAVLTVLATVSCEKEIALEGITLSQDAVTLDVGGTATLTVSFKPSNVSKAPTVEWSSSKDAVATVAAGVVTAVAPGSAVITAKAGTFTATCTVTVNEQETPPGPEDPYTGPVTGTAEWSVIGALLEKNWDTDFDCAEANGGFVLKDVRLTTSNEFKFRHNHDWGDNRGINEPNVATIIETAVPTKAVPNGGNIKVAADGQYDLWYFADKEAIVVVAAGASLPDVPSFAVEPDNFDYTPGADYLAADNLWKPVDEAKNVKFFYYMTCVPDWSVAKYDNIGSKECEYLYFDQSTYRLTFEEETPAGRWANQFYIMPDEGNFIPLSASKSYKLKMTVQSTDTFNGFFKLVTYNAANAPKCEGATVFELAYPDGLEMVADTPVVVEKEFAGLDAENIVLLFDFGGNPAGAKVYIKDITLVETGAPVDPNAYSLIGCHAYDNSNPWGWTTNFDSEVVDGDWRVVKGIGAFQGQIDFKFRKGDDWGSQLGAVLPQEKELNLLFKLRGIDDSGEPKNIILKGEGMYDVYLNPVEMLGFILEAGTAFAVPTEMEVEKEIPYSLIGCHAADPQTDTSWGWGTNMAMTDVEAYPGWTKVTLGPSLGRMAFKFRKGADWGTQIGALNDNANRQTGILIPLTSTGAADIVYYSEENIDVYLNATDMVCVIYPEGYEFTIPTETETLYVDPAITIDGDMSDWADAVGVKGGEGPYYEFKVSYDENNIYFYSKRNFRDNYWGNYGYFYYGIDEDNNPATKMDSDQGMPGVEEWVLIYPFGGSNDSPAIEHTPGDGGINNWNTVKFPDNSLAGVIGTEYVETEFACPRSMLNNIPAGSTVRFYSWGNKDASNIKTTPLVIKFKK